MIEAIGELDLAQEDGRPPITLSAGRPPGESGVSVLAARFDKGVHFSGILRQNLILFPMSQIRVDCRLADRHLAHKTELNTLSICPSGIDCAGSGTGSADLLFVAVHQMQLALAAAEDFDGYGILRERFAGRDLELLHLAHRLWQETAAGYPNGPLLWSELSTNFVICLLQRHAADSEIRRIGTLNKSALRRIKEYITAHLDEPIDIPTLANVACLSPFHFARLFANSVGSTPHQYVIRLRLQCALKLIRESHMGLAHIAASTGFADQAHMSRWFRRVYGVPPSQVIAETQ
jgi:AraC family transcriptional regulator